MDTYECAACGRKGLTNMTAVVVDGTTDCLCGRVIERPIRSGMDYEVKADVSCLNIYATQQAIRGGSSLMLTVGAIQQLKKTNDPQRV